MTTECVLPPPEIAIAMSVVSESHTVEAQAEDPNRSDSDIECLRGCMTCRLVIWLDSRADDGTKLLNHRLPSCNKS